MKNLLFLLLISGSVLMMCKGKEKDTKPIPPVAVDTTKFLPDVVLERPDMDEYAVAVNARKKPLGKPPKPGQPPPPPPPGNGCLLLDFDGHLVSGTMWNVNGDIPCASSGLSSAAQQLVNDSIKSRYAIFPTVLVTTSEAIFNTYPQNKRMRIIFTTSYEWYGSGAGGVAFLNSFTWFDETPCFVFTSLHGYNARNISDAGAHEAGHTLGCRHQSTYDTACVKISEYRWGPWIMGASYYDSYATWTIGPSSISCTYIQNDTANIFNTLRQ